MERPYTKQTKSLFFYPTCCEQWFFCGKFSPFLWKIFWQKKFLFENPFVEENLPKIATVTCNIIDCLRFSPFIFLILWYLAKYIYGWSPLQQHHKIEGKNHWLWGIQFIDIFCRYCLCWRDLTHWTPSDILRYGIHWRPMPFRDFFFLCWIFCYFAKRKLKKTWKNVFCTVKFFFFNKKLQLLWNEKIRDKNINAYINVSSMSFLLAPLVIPYKYTINWRQLSKL